MWTLSVADPEALARARDRAVEAANNPRHRPLPRRFTTPVVGIVFVAEYPGNLQALEALAAVRLWRDDPTPIACTLIRERQNPVDPNAVLVMAEGIVVGHLTRAIACRLAPELDDGVQWWGQVVEVRVSPLNPDQPGIDVRLERQ